MMVRAGRSDLAPKSPVPENRQMKKETHAFQRGKTLNKLRPECIEGRQNSSDLGPVEIDG